MSRAGKVNIGILTLGAVFSLIYFLTSYYIIKLFKITVFAETTKEKNIKTDEEAKAFISALGGTDNIINIDACITRLRIKVQDSSTLSDDVFLTLGAKGVIRPDRHSIQVVLGTKAESVAENMKSFLKNI